MTRAMTMAGPLSVSTVRPSVCTPYILGAQRDSSNEQVLSSTHNIYMFWCRNKK